MPEQASVTRHIEVRLFGAFKSWFPEGRARLELPAEADVSDLRAALSRHLVSLRPDFDDGLVKVSAVGSNERILHDSDSLGGLEMVALLPPVSGG